MEWLNCSCCGKSIRDTADENRDHGAQPNPHDAGYGMCIDCGGDKTLKGHDEATVKRRLGWAGQTFYEARFGTIRRSITPTNRAKFDAMTYAKKLVIVAGLIEKGVLI